MSAACFVTDFVTNCEGDSRPTAQNRDMRILDDGRTRSSNGIQSMGHSHISSAHLARPGRATAQHSARNRGGTLPGGDDTTHRGLNSVLYASRDTLSSVESTEIPVGTQKPPDPPLETREFISVAEIERAAGKLERCITEVEALDVQAAVVEDSGEDDVVESNIRETIREVFGNNSPEFREHQYISVWAGPMSMGMSQGAALQGKERGKKQVATILRGLVVRLSGKKEEFEAVEPMGPTTYFEQLNLHPRIAGVANDLYLWVCRLFRKFTA